MYLFKVKLNIVFCLNIPSFLVMAYDYMCFIHAFYQLRAKHTNGIDNYFGSVNTTQCTLNSYAYSYTGK